MMTNVCFSLEQKLKLEMALRTKHSPLLWHNLLLIPENSVFTFLSQKKRSEKILLTMPLRCFAA